MKQHIFTVLVLLILCSCTYQEYKAAPIVSEKSFHDVISKDINDPGFKSFLQESGYQTWPIETWNFKEIYLTALYFNPEVALYFAELELSEAAALAFLQRENPRFSLPIEHHSDTGGSVSPWLIGVLFDFVFERKAKRQAKQDITGAEIESALMKLKKSVWQLRTELKVLWIRYSAALALNDFIESELSVLESIHEILQKEYELGQISYFEVSNTRLELQRLAIEKSHHQTVISDAYHNMMKKVGLLPENFTNKEFVFIDELEKTTAQAMTQPDLQRLALLERYDVNEALLEYKAHEAMLRLEIEKQYPDITLSPGFIFDQDDKIWALATSWVLPVFHRNEAKIKQALAKRLVLQKQFQVMQSNLIHELSKNRMQFLTRIDSLNQSQGLVEELEKREAAYNKQFEAGYTGKLELLRSQLETLRAKHALFQIRVASNISLANIEALTESPLGNHHQQVEILKALTSLHQKDKSSL